MSISRITFALTGLSLAAIWAQNRPQETVAWAPKKPAGWVAPNKPHWTFADILA